MELAPHQELGSYRLIRKLGAGGMGEVWEAEDSRLRRTVAIKILPAAVAADAEAQARFTREARTAAQLYHPNIATIHSIEQSEDRSYIVMEYVRGESLSQLIRSGPPSEAVALRIARQVAEALKEAHGQGIVHRDIKPDNIMVSGDRVKVLDFGIAKRVGAAQKPLGSETTGFVTEAGMIMGTVFYMSPEQALGKPLDARTDIFSLGVVLYQALTGRLPFRGETVTETLTRIIRDEPEPLRIVNPAISASTGRIVEQCMAKNRNDRFASAGELVDAIDGHPRSVATLRGGASGEPTQRIGSDPTQVMRPFTSSATEQLAPRRSWMWMGLTGLLAGTLAAALMYRGQPPGSAVGNRPLAVSTVPAPSVPSDDLTVSASTVRDVTGAVSTTETVTGTVASFSAPPPLQALPTPVPTRVMQAAAQPDTAPNRSIGASPSAEGLYEEGQAQLARGDRIGAMKAFREALQRDPDHAPSRLKVAQIAFLNRNFPEAARQFDLALQNRSRLDERQTLLAGIGQAILSQNFERAQQLGAEFDLRYPGDPDVAIFRAEVKRQAKPRRDSQQNPPNRPLRRRPRPGTQ